LREIRAMSRAEVQAGFNRLLRALLDTIKTQ
jgi:hypothetical protein